MYQRLGHAVVRLAIPLVAGWGLVVAFLSISAPDWKLVTKDGEFAFLPDDAQSQRAAALYRETLHQQRKGINPLYSNIVIAVHRNDRSGRPRGQDGMDKEDLKFIHKYVVPAMQRIQQTVGRGYESLTPEERASSPVILPESEQVITTIVTKPLELKSEEADIVGALLASEDGRAVLVYLQLNSEMLDRSNNLVISEVERALNDPELLRQKPGGLAMDLSGTAVVGRDLLRAEQVSASRTEAFTQWLVILLLLLIYRAPLLAMIPLITVGVSVQATLKLLSILAGWNWIGVFTGLEVYVTVVVYGAGVDYCLFLIARYREELDRTGSLSESIHAAVTRVGAALATSAGTSIFGIGMLAFADFGKFRQAGIAISLGLTVALCSALTFTPALLHLCGRWAFWPDLRRERLEAGGGWLPTFSLTRFLAEQDWLERGWRRVAEILLARPGTVFIATVLLCLPFAVVGFCYQNHLSYGLLTDLPQRDPSVLGAKAVKEHFAAGVAGPMVMLLEHPEFDLGYLDEGPSLKNEGYRPSRGQRVSRSIVEQLTPQLHRLGIADIRCQAHPLGLTDRAKDLDAGINRAVLRRALVRRSWTMYSCITGPHAGTVMQIDLISEQDPFQRDSIAQLDQVEEAVRAAVPSEYQAGLELYTLGPTASLRDLKLVTDHDRILIDVLVVLVVYVLLVALLRQPGICAYLLLTVVFSFLVTLGTTYLVFRIGVGGSFSGLDWKIPLFLFTILIAIGEDYNILLMARVREEQKTHGLIRGVLVALTRTGGIISSCGIIMAGTFASLMTGTLLGMVEMGFALAFGVLLDTFVVRPILVPSFLILLYSGRLGFLSEWANPQQVQRDGLAAPAPASGEPVPASLTNAEEAPAPLTGEFAEK